MNCTDHERIDPKKDPELPPPGRRPNARYARKTPIPAPLIKAVMLARFHSRAVMFSARSAPGMEYALCNVSRKPNAFKIGYPRVHCYLANSGEDIGCLCCLDTHSERDLQMQPPAIDVRLDFMALRWGVNSGPCKQWSYPRAAEANSNVKRKKRTCWAKSKSDLVATKRVGI
jgi:hypothetical protein